MAWERAQIRKSKPKPRTRLTIEDFEAIGVNVAKELWAGLSNIEDPGQYMDYFFRMLSFVTPKLNAIDIQQEISTYDAPDLSVFKPEDLVKIIKNQEREGKSTV
jgi:hypothetical protein